MCNQKMLFGLYGACASASATKRHTANRNVFLHYYLHCNASLFRLLLKFPSWVHPKSIIPLFRCGLLMFGWFVYLFSCLICGLNSLANQRTFKKTNENMLLCGLCCISSYHFPYKDVHLSSHFNEFIDFVDLFRLCFHKIIIY